MDIITFNRTKRCTESSAQHSTTQCNRAQHNITISLLVSGALCPVNCNEILSGLKEIFTKRYIVEGTNKGEIRPENRVRKRRVVGRIYGMTYG